MSGPSLSLHNRTSFVASSEYRPHYLLRNGIEFFDVAEAVDNVAVRAVTSILKLWNAKLRVGLDQSIELPEPIRVRLSLLMENVFFQENGYRDTAVVHKALELHQEVIALNDARKTQWTRLFFSDIWGFFKFTDKFTFRYILDSCSKPS